VRGLAAHLTTLYAVSLLAPIALLLTSCSGGNGSLSVTLTADFKGAYTPGATDADFALTVQNLGPGNASGVKVSAVMPASFKYVATNSILTNGAALTTPEEAGTGSSNPEWGLWSLSSPTSPNGKTDYASITIDFGVNVTAQPATYSMVGQVIDDSLTQTVQSKAISVEVKQAPRLSVALSVGPSAVHPGGQVTYKVTVTNAGTGIAAGVDVLVTLPPVLQYVSTIMPFGGNASVETPIFPVAGAYLVFFGGFDLPPQTSLGPGTLTIQFIAECIPDPGKGSFTSQAQVIDQSTTDQNSDIVSIKNVAPLNVIPSS
jgi:uncharacterized repeat protein (TIGR01451 family)